MLPPVKYILSLRRRVDHGPLVKRLRHRPFTAATGVRIPYGSPRKQEDAFYNGLLLLESFGPVVQLVRTLACHARGRGFEPLPGRHILFASVLPDAGADIFAGVAQQVEQLTCNQQVGGSIPSASSSMQRVSGLKNLETLCFTAFP